MTANVGPAEYVTFHGGFTDYYVEGPIEKGRVYDNVQIVQTGTLGKLEQRYGSRLYSDDYPQIPPGAQRINTLLWVELNQFLLAHSSKKIYALESTGWVNLVGPTSNDAFPTGVDTNTVLSSSKWNKHLLVASSQYTKPLKVYRDGLGNKQLRTAGMPPLATAPTGVGTAGADTYLYKFLYKYTYTVGTVTHTDYGPTTTLSGAPAVQVANVVPGTVVISNIPVLANGTSDNYDTANVKVEIYRTINAGIVFYRVGEVTNGTTSYNDTTLDATLQLNEVLYTEGGVVENDSPPLCKLVHIMEGIAFYANIKDGTEILENRVLQSIDGDIDAVPATFYVDVDYDIVGISSAKNTPVILCDRAVYRIDGRYDLLGRNGMVAQKISDTASCISSSSVVQTFDGVFWWGLDGIYYTDGYGVQKTNIDWDKTYASLIATEEQRRRIQGVYNAIERRIYWTVQSSVGTDNDRFVVLDLNWPITRRSTYCTWSGTTNFAPTSIVVDFDGNVIRADKRGYVFKHNPAYFSDLRVDTGADPSTWKQTPIIYTYESCATNFGSSFERKWVSNILVNLGNVTNLSMAIISINDDGKKVGYLKPLRYRGNFSWGDPSVIWGDPSLVWNRLGVVEAMRRFPAKGLRCSYKQVKFTNDYSVIVTSALLGTIGTNGTTKVCTLTNSVDYQFPDNIEDYYLSIGVDGYMRQYRILSVSGATITVEDTLGMLQTLAGQSFMIKGYPKNEYFSLHSYCLHVADFGSTQQNYQAGESGSL